jgi:hypothetical protein
MVASLFFGFEEFLGMTFAVPTFAYSLTVVRPSACFYRWNVASCAVHVFILFGWFFDRD